MAQTQTEASGHRFEVKPTADSHFSWMRTRMSLERTLMSWVRTSTALIGFGFTIVQFFERIKSADGVKAAAFPDAPRYLGLALILTGVVALVLSIWQYRSFMRYMWSSEFAPIAGVKDAPGSTPLLATAIVLALIGAFAFGAVLLRVF
jgi:putative membrane protein